MKKLVVLTTLFAFVLIAGASADLTDGLLFYYTMDNAQTSGTTINDISNNSLSGTITSTNPTTGVTGYINEAYDYDGATTGNVRPNEWQLQGASGTLAAWCNTDTTAAGLKTCFSNRETGASGRMYIGVDGTQFETVLGSTTRNAGSVSASTWYHIAVTWNSTTGNTRVYINGSYESGLSGAVTYSDTEINNNMSTGMYGISGTTFLWNGVIDEFAGWNRTLADSEISELYSKTDHSWITSTTTNATVTANSFYSSNTINTFNVTFNGSIYATTNGTVVLPVLTNSTSLYDINISAENHFTNQSTNINLSTTYNAELIEHTSIYATDASDNTSISNFTISWNSTNYTTTTGIVYLPLYNTTNQNVSITTSGEYNDDSALLNASPYLQLYNFTLYPDPSSIQIYIYDAESGTLATENITITASGNTFSETRTTTNGETLFGNLTTGIYTFTFSGANYTSQTYTLTIGTNTYQTLNAWLSTNTSNLRFIMRDWDSALEIENVSVTMQRIVNNTWVTVESRLSDITGRVLFQYLENTRYRFTTSKTGYTSRTFELNPVDPLIAEEGYTVRIRKSTTQTDPSNFAGVNIEINPTTYKEGLNNFTYYLFSPEGQITEFGYTLTFPGGTTSDSSNEAYGTTLSTTINISGASLGDTVNLTYYITDTIRGTRNYTASYFIDVTTNTWTFTNIRDTDYGFTLFEKLIIATLGIIVVGGAAFLFLGGLAGGIVALITMGFFYWIGFLTLWMILPSIFGALFLIIWRGSQ